MNRIEFLNRLEDALVGKLNILEVKDNINYYNRFIDDEMAKGKSEYDVIQSLGDPRLLARTIIMTSSSGEQNESAYYSESYSEAENINNQAVHYKNYNLNSITAKIVFWVVVALFVVFAVWIGGIILKLLIKIGIPCLVFYIIYRLIRDYRR